MTLDLSKIDTNWTLFLDRDGVINEERQGYYVLHRGEFFMYKNAAAALKTLAEIFTTIVLVTNQKGVGKGLMSLADLEDIHLYMSDLVEVGGGRIDKIFYCTDLDDNSPNRKPNHGMALQAKEQFPAIDFSRCLIAGNKLSDMQFGRNAGMYTVFIASTNPDTAFPHPLIDARFNSLFAFSEAVKDSINPSGD